MFPVLPLVKQSQNEKLAHVSWLSSATWSKTNRMFDFVISILITKRFGFLDQTFLVDTIKIIMIISTEIPC